MKILYLSCHSILEYDEVRLLRELGHYVFSPGAYFTPEDPGEASMRPGLYNLDYNPEDVELWNKLSKKGIDTKNLISKEFFDRFDLVIIMHLPEWVKNNWERMKHKPIVLRTIGQFIARNEAEIAPYVRQGLKIIRYSPRERTNPGFCGESALIRFYKDPDEYGPWNGQLKEVLTVAQHMQDRDRACNFTFFEQVTRPFPRRLIGPGNEKAGPYALGKLPYDEIKKRMRDHRVYFYTGTHPASVTLNFIESAMTGCPIVAIGPEHGNAKYFPGHNLYEVPDIIRNGDNGFISDNVNDLRRYIKDLLEKDTLAEKISKNIRLTAIELFGKQKIKEEWKSFIEAI
jgi:glycosyltransferase involved in cell wall biosynthesis